MATLIILRHGQSEYNLRNLFTGWSDIGISSHGAEEAKQAAIKIKDEEFDIIYTSNLKRAWETLNIIVQADGFEKIPIIKTQAFNERRYGDLEGKNKQDIIDKFGAEQVHLWRRSYDVAPPNGESLKDTYDRVVPYYQKEVEIKLKNGDEVLIVAHGNSLRALMMYLEKLTPEEILEVNLPTGIPRKYIFDGNLNLLKVDDL